MASEYRRGVGQLEAAIMRQVDEAIKISLAVLCRCEPDLIH